MTDNRPTRASAVLDGEHWQGTPEHVRYTLGCQIERLAEVSVDAEDPEDLCKMTAMIVMLAKSIGATWMRPAAERDEYAGREDDEDGGGDD